MNNAFAVSCGKQSSMDVVGKTDKDIWSRELADKYQTDDALVMQSAKSIIVDELIKEQGEPKWFETFKTPVKDSNGIVIGTTGYSRDITERKRVENELLKLSLAVKQSPASIIITDTEGNIEYINPKVTEITGYQLTEVLGKKPRIFQSGEKPKSEYKILWDTIISGKEWRGELHNKKKNGELYWEFASISPIKNTNGKIINYLAVKEDITQNKKDQEEISRMANVLEATPDLVGMLDADGNTIYLNRGGRMFMGISDDEDITKLKLNNYHPESVVQLIIQEGFPTAAKEGFWRSETKLLSRTGEEIPVLQVILCHKNSKNIVTHYSTIMRDISVSKRIERELIAAKDKAEEMSRLKSNFLANMSHELRTPLIGINGFSEILIQSLEDPELKDMAETILKSGNRLSETLNLILDISKFESEKMDFKLEPVDLVSETEETINLFKETARVKGLTIKSSYSNAVIYFNTDRRAYRSVINNLINNAIKFTIEGGITISITLKDNFTEIKVIDTGIGIAKKDHEIIFDEFRQVSEGFSRNFEGSGLGLSITKKLVEKFGGKISVESEVGKGSTFTVILPVTEVKVKKEIPLKEINLTKELPEPKTLKPLALLVDDDPIVFQVLNRYISDYAEMDSTPDADFAIKMLKEKKYDIVFMDINLRRGMDGRQAAQDIRKMQGYESTPIIAITAYAMEGDKEEFLAAGCSHYLSKPFTKGDVLNLLSEIFGSR